MARIFFSLFSWASTRSFNFWSFSFSEIDCCWRRSCCFRKCKRCSWQKKKTGDCRGWRGRSLPHVRTGWWAPQHPPSQRPVKESLQTPADTSPRRTGITGPTQPKTFYKRVVLHTLVYARVARTLPRSLTAGGRQACASRALTQSQLHPVCGALSGLSFLLSAAYFLLWQTSFPRSLIYLLKETGTKAKGFMLKKDKLVSEEKNL